MPATIKILSSIIWNSKYNTSSSIDKHVSTLPTVTDEYLMVTQYIYLLQQNRAGEYNMNISLQTGVALWRMTLCRNVHRSRERLCFERTPLC